MRRLFQYCGLVIGLALSFLPAPGFACWEGDISLRAQIEMSSTPTLVRVLEVENLPAADMPVTQVTFEELSLATFEAIGTGTLSYHGGFMTDGTAVKVSTSPRLKQGETYLVFLSGDGEAPKHVPFGNYSVLPVFPVGAIGPDELPTVDGNAVLILDVAHGVVSTGEFELTLTTSQLTKSVDGAQKVTSLTLVDIVELLLSIPNPTEEV